MRTVTLFKRGITGLLLVASGAAFALPELQLTIPGGTYNGSVETTIASGQTFDVYALFDPKKDSLSDTFYISVALELGLGDSPVTGAVVNGGSFVFNGTTVNVTSSMTQGTPGALPTHGDFATWYQDFSFQFVNDSAHLTTAFDAQTTTPASISGGCAINCVFFMPFSVDTSLLNSAYSIHFDLYDQATRNGSNQGVNAPFSHDAQSTSGGCTDAPCGPRQQLPEPATWLLAALGFAGIAIARRRSR